MIKLKKIYNEIKLINSNNIDPEKVKKLYFSIDADKWYYLGENEKNEWYNEVLKDIKQNFHDEVENLSKEQLKEIYVKLLKFKDKYNL